MTTTHTETPGADARETALPTVRRRRKRRDWGRVVAKALCLVLALVGLVPFATTLAVRSNWVRTWAARETESALRTQGIVARYAVALKVWPLAVELTDVRVEARGGGAPVLECTRARIRPKLFALLAGKLAIDQIEVDQPRVHVVVKDGKLANLLLPETPAGKGPTHAPFNAFALTDASLDLQIDDVRVDASAIDLDVTVEDDPTAGSTYELAMRVGRAGVHRPRVKPDGSVASDDDALCSVDGRVRIEPGAILVRRLEGVGSADLDAAPGTTPACDLPADDKRRVELSLGHLHVLLPTGSAKVPYFDGHVRVRAPLALAERAAALPETDGWAALDADVRYGDDTLLPDLGGTLEAHNVRLDKYSFAPELHSQVSIRRNLVESPLTTLRFAGGLVTLTDTVVDPLARRLEKTRLDAANVDFTTLLRDLGVHPHSWVGWDIREVHTQVISGTIVPLKLDGELTAKTYTFGVYDRPAEDKARERIFGVLDAQIATHVAIRQDALNFVDARVTMPRSHVEGALVSIGFHSILRVEAPHVAVDLDDVSPMGPVMLHGKVQTSGRVTGTFHNPEPEGDIQSITGFGVADMQFGDLSSGHVKVDVHGPEVEITGVHARRRESAYDVPTATLKFGGTRGFVVDAVASTGGFGLRDLLSMFALDEDPRYDGLDARIATRADVHVALGGPEDKCGAGYIAVDAKGHLTGVGLFGEKFAQGDADMSMRWYDRDAGIAGADLDVRSFVLSKVQPASGTRPVAIGTLLGSAEIRRGGTVSANVMIEGVSLSRVDALSSLGGLEGSASGMAHVSGSLDDFKPDPGLVTRAEVDVSGTRLREVPLASSHLQVEMTQRFPPQRRAVGHTRCGAPIAPPFDKAAYLADSSSHGEWKVNGELLGGTVRLTDLVATRAKAPRMSGRVAFRGVDLGPLARIYSERKGGDSTETLAGSSATAIGGQLWGELIAEDVPLDDPSHAVVSFLLGPTVLSRGTQKIELRPPQKPITIVGDTLTVPPLAVTLDASDGFTGAFVVTGEVTHLTRDPTLALDAKLEPIDLAVLQRLIPKVERARGKVEGSVRVTGKAKAPVIAGELHAVGEEIAVHGLPSALTDLHLDVRASATELTANGAAKFAGGTVSLATSVPVRGFEVGTLDSHVIVRGVRLAPSDGISATFDADLEVAYDAKAQAGREGASLPRVTGDVTIGSFGYTRPISLTTDLGALGTRARRTEVNAYDPALDLVAFDVHVRAKSPLVIKNNLAEVQLGIDSGTLEVTGTNQRIGLRGALKALPGGRFHFQSNEFEVRQGLIRFDDPTRVSPNVDVTAVTEYRRYTDTSAGAAAGAGSGGTTGASLGSTRGGSVWRITLHAFGDAENLRVDMTSEPSLSQEDIVLLLAVGMTRAELDQLQASSIGASIALNYLGAASGADRAVKQALPIIDDFRFGSAYSTVTGKTEPQLTVGKRLTNDLRASVTAGLSEDRELRSNIEWRLNNRLSVQGSYDNINDVSSSAVGNLGVDLRWRLEFE